MDRPTGITVLGILLIIVSVTIATAYAEQFLVKTDKSFYEQGNTIVVSGFINNLNENYNQPVMIRIVDPVNNIVTIQQVSVNSNGTFESSIVISGTYKEAGEYTVLASYGASKGETSFEFAGGQGYAPPPKPKSEPPISKTHEVKILASSSIEGCQIANSCLSPTKLTILKGDVINWIREEDTSHFLVSRTDGQLNWSTLDYSHTFTHAGIFPYTIQEMPWVQGEITVQYSQARNNIPNSIKIISEEKIGDSLHLGYEGHINTEGGKLMIYTTDTNQHVVNHDIAGDYDGYFSETLIDVDDRYHTWIDGEYRIEFWSVDGDNNNQKSDIIETTFILGVPSFLKIESEPISQSEDDDLRSQIAELKLENRELKIKIDELNQKIENLNQIILEQLKVIYDWITLR